MKCRAAIAVLIIVLAGTLGRLYLRQTAVPIQVVPENHSPDLVGQVSPGLPEAPVENAGIEMPSSTEAVSVPVKPRRAILAAAAEPSESPGVISGVTPVTLLENVRAVFRQYSMRFGGNPIGTNPEITAALNGANPRQVVFLNPEDGMRVNERGQLVDNWGTPFFFHQISRTDMEIHSAGPDRRMWTGDDLVIK
jgi:hypothetical protein